MNKNVSPFCGKQLVDTSGRYDMYCIAPLGHAEGHEYKTGNWWELLSKHNAPTEDPKKDTKESPVKTEQNIRDMVAALESGLRNGACYRPEFYAYRCKQIEALKWALGEAEYL